MREAFRRAGMNVPDEPERREAMVTRTSPQNRNCDHCGKTFEPSHPSHRLCDDCHSQRRSPGGWSGGGQQGQNAPAFPDSYFILDQGRPCLHTTFVSKRTVDPLAATMANAHPPLTTGQIRRFFNHCRDIERRLKVDGESWPQVAADFESLSAHAQYASSGQNRKIPVVFRQFIDSNINRITSSEDPRVAFLEGFVPHFEALVGFGAAHMRAS